MLPRIDPLAEAGRHRAHAAELQSAAPGVRRGTVSADIGHALMQAERLEALAVDQALDRVAEAATAAAGIARQVTDARAHALERLARRAAALRVSQPEDRP